MNLPASTRYTKTAVILHWLIGLTILVMFAIGWYMVDLPKKTPEREFFLNLHKSVGFTLLIFIIARLLWRFTHKPPPYLASLRPWEKALADAVHKLLYLLMVVMPLSGLLMTLSGKYGLKWFGIHLIDGVPNEAARKFFDGMHGWVALVLITVISIHILAALKHILIDRDGTLRRMSLR